jgi:RNA polymerase sigma-70 factor (ECF subfamily)
MVSSDPSPPDLFAARELSAFLHTQLDRLPEKYRLVLTLRYLQHLSYAEMAAALEVPMGTVQTHLHRARRLLRERLRRWQEHTPGSESDMDISSRHPVPCLQGGGE